MICVLCLYALFSLCVSMTLEYYIYGNIRSIIFLKHTYGWLILQKNHGVKMMDFGPKIFEHFNHSIITKEFILLIV